VPVGCSYLLRSTLRFMSDIVLQYSVYALVSSKTSVYGSRNAGISARRTCGLGGVMTSSARHVTFTEWM
jgi:hypothetical protein